MAWDIQALFRRHAKDITRSLCRRGLSEETAADIMQDTFVRVLTAVPSDGAAVQNPKAYLYRVSRNLSINHHRRERLVEMLNLDDEAFGEIADPAPTPEKIVHDRQLLRQTEAALAELPERTRLAFELHRLGENTLAEIAQKIGVSPTRVWVLIREAYRHIVLRTGGL